MEKNDIYRVMGAALVLQQRQFAKPEDLESLRSFFWYEVAPGDIVRMAEAYNEKEAFARYLLEENAGLKKMVDGLKTEMEQLRNCESVE